MPVSKLNQCSGRSANKSSLAEVIAKLFDLNKKKKIFLLMYLIV